MERVRFLTFDIVRPSAPKDRYVRNYFYEMAGDAALEAVVLCSNKQISNRMKLTAMFPEMNPSMDSYRYVHTQR